MEKTDHREELYEILTNEYEEDYYIIRCLNQYGNTVLSNSFCAYFGMEVIKAVLEDILGYPVQIYVKGGFGEDGEMVIVKRQSGDV